MIFQDDHSNQILEKQKNAQLEKQYELAELERKRRKEEQERLVTKIES